MAARKSGKKPKARARKTAKVKNPPAKPLSGDVVRSVKGGDTYDKVVRLEGNA